jgi:hypothetical protein
MTALPSPFWWQQKKEFSTRNLYPQRLSGKPSIFYPRG